MTIRLRSYRCILADPPWSFKTFTKTGTPHRSAEDHYATVDIEELMRLPVGALAAKDCALFMWVVDSHIPEALALGRAWGFKLKTRAFTWVKTSAKTGRPLISMGYWTRKGSEICLLFTKGNPKRLSKGVREVIFAPRREHSRKPDEVRQAIEQLVSGPRVELFARSRNRGWHQALSNEADKFKGG